MRFNGERRVAAVAADVWTGLHDRAVLSAAIPGCRDMVPLPDGRYAATLQARVGPVSDTYRGSFRIEDLHAGRDLRVRVDARGRCGRLQVDLRVILAEATHRTTTLRYDADCTVSGLVSRLGGATLSVTGGHFTGCFFRDLDRALTGRTAAAGPAPATIG
jgi:uncharacterized protein